jgi:tRNA 2-thiouridine synthesizing protein C
MHTRPTLFLLHRAPYGNTATRDWIDAVLASASFDQPLQLLFTGEGVWSLLPGQKGEKIDMKDIGKLLGALPYYDINAVFVDGEALATRQLDAASLVLPATVLDTAQLRELMREAAQVISL